MSREITCNQFFDGDVLHGPRRIVVADSGLVESITLHDGASEYPLICPGFVDVQMNGLNDVHVANASTENLLELDTALLECGTTSWLGTIVTASLEKMSASLASLHESFK